jgi:deazaflavin-dependent oxidoreductase (nitroreductase family)
VHPRPRAEGDFAIVASNFGQRHNPAWYYNLKANPRVSCTLGGAVASYHAHEAQGEEYDRFWRLALETYIGFPGYRERAGERHIPIMVLRRIGGAENNEHAASGMP